MVNRSVDPAAPASSPQWPPGTRVPSPSDTAPVPSADENGSPSADVGAIEGRYAATAPRVALRERQPVTRASRFLALEDFERTARRHLPRMLYGYIAGSAETGAAFEGNRASFARLALLPRVLVDTGNRSQSVTLFGRSYGSPFGIAPLGAAALSAYRGDLALARGAAAAAIPMVLSASSLIPMEDVQRCGVHWYQAYLPGEPARIEALVQRVAQAGFEVLVLTADVPVAANRENNARNGFSLPVVPTAQLCWQALAHPAWLIGTALRTWRKHGIPHFENMDATRGPPILSRDLVRELGSRDRLTWEHVRLIRQLWRGKLIIKGILSPEDAVLARDCGADGIIVSNHGGRQLDGALAPLEALPAILARQTGLVVMLDGGIRRGTDVLKALALGAQFVFLGRPFMFAAAAGGATLVAAAAHLLRQEIDRDMALLGVTALHQLGPQHVVSRHRVHT